MLRAFRKGDRGSKTVFLPAAKAAGRVRIRAAAGEEADPRGTDSRRAFERAPSRSEGVAAAWADAYLGRARRETVVPRPAVRGNAIGRPAATPRRALREREEGPSAAVPRRAVPDARVQTLRCADALDEGIAALAGLRGLNVAERETASAAEPQ